MTGEERRKLIVELVRSNGPVSGKKLAEECGVSRQVIVQDMALIRAAGNDIISTNRGYIINGEVSCSRIVKVFHTDDQIEDELCTVVDLGGRVINVMINHKVYGRLEAELNIFSRRNVSDFMEAIHTGKSSPLKKITSDYHYHRIEADSEAVLDMIEAALEEKGYLVRPALDIPG